MNRRAHSVQFAWGHKTPQIQAKLPDIVPWIHEAGRPYFDIFLEGADPHFTLSRWVQRRSSEISLHRTRLLIHDDRIAGGYISLAGHDLPGARQADLLDLAREMTDRTYSELRERMEDLRDLFAPVEDNDFFVSKIGVLPSQLGRGLSQHLLDDCLRRARQGSFRRVRVDVPEHHQRARELFRAYGFEAVYRGKSSLSNLRYLAMVCDL
jgi:GNAT superfamily N-acetyltransferase